MLCVSTFSHTAYMTQTSSCHRPEKSEIVKEILSEADLFHIAHFCSLAAVCCFSLRLIFLQDCYFSVHKHTSEKWPFPVQDL